MEGTIPFTRPPSSPVTARMAADDVIPLKGHKQFCRVRRRGTTKRTTTTKKRTSKNLPLTNKIELTSNSSGTQKNHANRYAAPTMAEFKVFATAVWLTNRPQ